MVAAARHVKRIRKIVTDEDTGEQVLSDDVWIDVLRTDKLPITFGSTMDGVTRSQIINFVFLWNDDPNNPIDGIDASNADLQFENANAKRKMLKLAVNDPIESAPTDDSSGDNGVDLWIINKVGVYQRGFRDFPQGWYVENLVFNNNPADGSKGTPANRKVSP